VLGTKGRLRVEPAYEYAEGLAYEITADGRTTKRESAKRDQFAAELIYFSRCILNGIDPEPSGEEGLQDVRIVTASMNRRRLAGRSNCHLTNPAAARCETGDPSAARRQARDGKAPAPHL
jgi:predicted dehydrogenase